MSIECGRLRKAKLGSDHPSAACFTSAARSRTSRLRPRMCMGIGRSCRRPDLMSNVCLIDKQESEPVVGHIDGAMKRECRQHGQSNITPELGFISSSVSGTANVPKGDVRLERFAWLAARSRDAFVRHSFVPPHRSRGCRSRSARWHSCGR